MELTDRDIIRGLRFVLLIAAAECRAVAGMKFNLRIFSGACGQSWHSVWCKTHVGAKAQRRITQYDERIWFPLLGLPPGALDSPSSLSPTEILVGLRRYKPIASAAQFEAAVGTSMAAEIAGRITWDTTGHLVPKEETDGPDDDSL